MLIIDLLEELVPLNEQERKEKKEILKYINMFDDILRRDN
jgi:hypothetical protein